MSVLYCMDCHSLLEFKKVENDGAIYVQPCSLCLEKAFWRGNDPEYNNDCTLKEMEENPLTEEEMRSILEELMDGGIVQRGTKDVTEK